MFESRSSEESLKLPGAISQLVHADADFIQHGKEQIGHRCLVWINDVLTRLKPPTRASRHQDRQVVVIVSVAVTNAAAVNQHRVV